MTEAEVIGLRHELDAPRPRALAELALFTILLVGKQEYDLAL